MNKSILIGSFLLSWSALLAQDKSEVERGVKERDVPASALDWMKDAYEKHRKIRWYYQEDGSDISFEAKLKWKKRWNSIEFDTLGQVVDIEITTDWEDLPQNIRESLHHYLNTSYENWNILKIQQQWTGNPDDLEDLIDEHETKNLTIRYEIEYRGQTNTEDELWEGLFDQDGILIQKRKIILGNLNNLTY